MVGGRDLPESYVHQNTVEIFHAGTWNDLPALSKALTFFAGVRRTDNEVLFVDGMTDVYVNQILSYNRSDGSQNILTTTPANPYPRLAWTVYCDISKHNFHEV